MLAVQAAESVLAAARAIVSADWLLPKPALAKDKQRQEEAAAEQRWADNKCFMAPVLPPNPVDAAIRHIRADCTLRAAPLDANLAKIECDNIAHKAQALPTTTLPHPVAMFPSPPAL